MILVIGNKEAHKQAADINEGLLMLGILNKQEYDLIVNETMSLYKERGPIFQKDEAIRNASLSSMQFMLAAKNTGWDTCPMIGFDPDEIRKILSIEDKYEIGLMITLGKEKVESRKQQGYRKPVNEFVTII